MQNLLSSKKKQFISRPYSNYPNAVTILLARQKGFRKYAIQPHKEGSHPSALEGHGASRDKDKWRDKGILPGGVGIRPKASEDPMGVGKGLFGPKAWQVVHRESWG